MFITIIKMDSWGENDTNIADWGDVKETCWDDGDNESIKVENLNCHSNRLSGTRPSNTLSGSNRQSGNLKHNRAIITTLNKYLIPTYNSSPEIFTIVNRWIEFNTNCHRTRPFRVPIFIRRKFALNLKHSGTKAQAYECIDRLPFEILSIIRNTLMSSSGALKSKFLNFKRICDIKSIGFIVVED